MLINLPILALKVERWRWVLDALQVSYRWGRAFIAFSGGLSAGIVTPGRLGELVRVMYLSGDLGLPYGLGLFSVIMDRLLDLVFLSVVGGATLASWQLRFSLPTWFLPVMIPVTIMPVLLLVPAVRRKIVSWLEKRTAEAPDKKTDRLGRLSEALALGAARTLGGRSRKALLFALLYTLCAFCMLATQAYFLTRGLGLSLGWVEVFLILGLANLVAGLPLSVAGVGTRDAVFVLLLAARGIPAESAVALGAGILVCNVAFCFLLGFVIWEIWPPVHRTE